MPSKRFVKPAPAPMGAYSAAVSADGLIYVSGTLPRAASGGDDVAAQTRIIIASVGELLSTAGSSLDQVVAVTVYLKSATDFQVMNDAYRACWQSDLPTRTTIVADLILPGARVEMSMIALPGGAERAVVHPGGWLKSPSPYSYAIQAGELVFLSGVVSRRGKDNAVVTGDLTTQTRVVLDNAAALLEAANLTLADVVSSRVFITGGGQFDTMNAIYREYFPSNPPARATVVSGLAGSQYLIEMTMVAARGARRVIGTAPPGMPISPAVKAGRRLFLSGVVGNTQETGGDPAGQTREVLARIDRILREAGARPSDVVDSLVYLRDPSLYAAMDAEYRAFFGNEFPARTTIATPLLAPDGLVEIMVTAITE
jgi:2-iminobutanoate/2-iminopropanoate deaminase